MGGTGHGKFIHGSRCLATRRPIEHGNLPTYCLVSEIRAIRVGQSDATRLSVDSEQHRRGVRQVNKRRIFAVPRLRERLEMRVADATRHRKITWVRRWKITRTVRATVRRCQPAAHCFDEQAKGPRFLVPSLPCSLFLRRAPPSCRCVAQRTEKQRPVQRVQMRQQRGNLGQKRIAQDCCHFFVPAAPGVAHQMAHFHA